MRLCLSPLQALARAGGGLSDRKPVIKQQAIRKENIDRVVAALRGHRWAVKRDSPPELCGRGSQQGPQVKWFMGAQKA